ncbi:hypothetical protein L6164_020537 [Bauhinia variegata]|uniref:Uncharacterized protein n=1 Tax=Bauhinia variegata TaxID=167791 RepID=A0ACB9MWZ5_BAUVA|nr:hypothetical protein L6164_020537 [Bauhinia variegata]
METDKMTNKDMKVQMPLGTEIMSNGMEFQGPPNAAQGSSGLARQTSLNKNNCLCSPTTHAGSFRCRLHRTPSLQRTKSIESASLRDQANKDQIH